MKGADYTYRKNLTGATFEQALAAVMAALAEEGFGVLTEIDATATLKQKLGVDFRPYRILGACNPSIAYKALQIAPEAGALLPCNVVVQEIGGGVRIDIADPRAMFAVANQREFDPIVEDAEQRLRRVLEKLQ